jgi:hypothetical protein
MAVFTIAWENNAEQAISMESAGKTPSAFRKFFFSL